MLISRGVRFGLAGAMSRRIDPIIIVVPRPWSGRTLFRGDPVPEAVPDRVLKGDPVDWTHQ